MANPLDLPEQLTLPALQRHMHAQCARFGWDTHNNEKAFLLFIEEVGELAKAMRRALNLQIEHSNPDKPILSDAQVRENLAEEFADVLNYVLDLANRFGVDLEPAYCNSFERHKQRFWK